MECVCSTDTNTHVWKPTYDSVGQAGEVIRRDVWSVLPHSVDQVIRNGHEGAVARLQTDVVVLLSF